MSQGRIIECGVMSVPSNLPGRVTCSCVGLLRFINRFSQDVQGFNAGTVNQICLSTLAIQGAGALSQSPGLAVSTEKESLNDESSDPVSDYWSYIHTMPFS